jgi:hypothetical protein
VTRYSFRVAPAFAPHMPGTLLPGHMRWVSTVSCPGWDHALVTVDDADAPAAFEGQLADVTFTRESGGQRLTVVSRVLAVPEPTTEENRP